MIMSEKSFDKIPLFNYFVVRDDSVSC